MNRRGFVSLLVVSIVCLLFWIVFGLTIVNIVKAEESVNVKLGGGDVICEGVDAIPVLGVSYEVKEGFLGCELGIRGISTKLHDTQVEQDFLLGKEMGVLNVADYFVLMKFYLPHNLYMGAGVSYLDMYFVEDSRIYGDNHVIDADIDDEVAFNAVVGWNFAENWNLEAQYQHADIDVESHTFPHGILEARSRFNNYTISIVRKWKF